MEMYFKITRKEISPIMKFLIIQFKPDGRFEI